MNNIMKIVGWVFGLILIFLLISRASAVQSVLSTLTGASVKGIAVLQGRELTTVQI